MILLIDNYDSFTWNLVQRLGEIDGSLAPGRDLVVRRNDEITPDEAEALRGGAGPAGVIISPGPCTPAEAGVSAQIIERFAGRVPILGVCLGHQTLAALHHMRVERHTRPMHGKTSEIHHDGRGFFAGIPSPMVATRYHSLVVPVESVPDRAPDGSGWEVSAWTDEPDEAGGGQRVMMGLRRIWPPGARTAAPLEGVQFHPESFLTEHGPKLLANFLQATRVAAIAS